VETQKLKSRKRLGEASGLWSIESLTSTKPFPNLSKVRGRGSLRDARLHSLFCFDRDKGFILTAKPLKIKGVCDHHDLGSLGSAVYTGALERNWMLKAMASTGIPTSHNPPAPELLDLADKMASSSWRSLDMWKKRRDEFDYIWTGQWHQRDLEDHGCAIVTIRAVFMEHWYEVNEQWGHNPDAGPIAKELAGSSEVWTPRARSPRAPTREREEPRSYFASARSGGHKLCARPHVQISTMFAGQKIVARKPLRH